MLKPSKHSRRTVSLDLVQFKLYDYSSNNLDLDNKKANNDKPESGKKMKINHNYFQNSNKNNHEKVEESHKVKNDVQLPKIIRVI